MEFENYTLSLHNAEPFEVEVSKGNNPNSDAQVRQFVAAGNYHAGIRLLEFTEVFHDGVNVDYIDDDNDAWGDPPSNGDDGFGQVAYFRSHAKNVPDDSKMGTLSETTPNFWWAVEENGVVFGSGINTGAYAITLDDPDVPVGSRTPVDVECDSESTLYLGGGTASVTLSVEADEPVRVRDRLPRDCDAAHRTHDAGGGTFVEFSDPVGGDDASALSYYAVGVGDDATFGPVEYSADGGDTWRPVPGTVEANLSIGDGTPL